MIHESMSPSAHMTNEDPPTHSRQRLPPPVIVDDGVVKYYCAISFRYYVPRRIDRMAMATWCTCDACDAYRRIRGDADYDEHAPQEHAYLNREIDDALSQS